jgi:hypothetical protein
MKMNNRGGFDILRHTPMDKSYAAIAPNPDGFPDLMHKMGVLLSADYDWAEDVAALRIPTMLTFGDADSIPISHAEFFELLGGGQRDPGWTDRECHPPGSPSCPALPTTTASARRCSHCWHSLP